MSFCEEEPIGRLIYKTSLNIRNYAEKMLSPHDLTVEQFHILKHASLHTGLNQNQLCEQVEKKPANITRILDRLEKKEWLERRANPQDRRSSLIYLTDEGKKLIEEVSRDFEGYSSWFLKNISREEEKLFRDVLGKIDSNIKILLHKIAGD